MQLEPKNYPSRVTTTPHRPSQSANTEHPLLLRTFAVAFAHTVGNWASKFQSGTPCLTRWAVHDHCLPLFTATRRSRIGQFSPHQWHSGYQHHLQERNQSCGFETIDSSLNYEVEILKEAIVRGTARQAPSYLPPVNVNLRYVQSNPNAKNEWTQSKKKQLQVVLETLNAPLRPPPAQCPTCCNLRLRSQPSS